LPTAIKRKYLREKAQKTTKKLTQNQGEKPPNQNPNKPTEKHHQNRP